MSAAVAGLLRALFAQTMEGDAEARVPVHAHAGGTAAGRAAEHRRGSGGCSPCFLGADGGVSSQGRRVAWKRRVGNSAYQPGNSKCDIDFVPTIHFGRIVSHCVYPSAPASHHSVYSETPPTHTETPRWIMDGWQMGS